MEESIRFTQEIRSVGLASDRTIDSVPVVSGDKALSALVIAAHRKSSDAPELTNLRDYLKADTRWDAYVDARKKPIQQARQLRYREETDALRLKADEDYVVGSAEWLAAIEAWKAEKAAIRSELPYEVE